jgi:hypothetical protein
VQVQLGNGNDTLSLGTGAGASVTFGDDAVFSGGGGNNTAYVGDVIGPYQLKNF